MSGLARLCGTSVCYPRSVSEQFTVDRALRGISQAGLRSVELVAISGYCAHLDPGGMSRSDIDALTVRLRHYQLTVAAVSVAAELTSQEGAELVVQTCRIARELGAGIVVTNVEGATGRAGEERLMRVLPAVIAAAEENDVVICLEVHGGPMVSGVEGVRFLRQIGSPRIKMTYDMANVVFYSGKLPEDDLAEMGTAISQYVGHVHLKDKANLRTGDYNFPPLGAGVLDVRAVIEHLESAGYGGYLTLEVELDGAPQSARRVDDGIAQSYDFMQSVYAGRSA